MHTYHMLFLLNHVTGLKKRLAVGQCSVRPKLRNDWSNLGCGGHIMLIQARTHAPPPQKKGQKYGLPNGTVKYLKEDRYQK